MANLDTAEMRENASTRSRGLDLFAFLHYLLARMKVIIAVVAAVAVLTAIYAFILATPEYEATALLYVVSSRDSAINLSDLQIGSYLTSDYQLIFDTWEVNQQIINNLDLPYTVKQMREKLTVTNPNNTRVLKITFASTDAKEAAAVANEYAEVASQYISDYMRTDMPSTISVALEPLQPARPRKLLLISVSMLLSALLMVWFIYIIYLYDDKIKTVNDLSNAVNAEPLAVIPATKMHMAGGRQRNRMG